MILKEDTIELPDHIAFIPGMPFYEMTMSFMTSLSIVGFVLNNEKLLGLKEKDYISVEGKYVNGRHFYPYDILKIVNIGAFTLQTYINSCCCMLANTAFESVKNKNNKSPEFELLRHIRNASSHNNIFNFFPNEPSSPTSWREAVIDHKIKGKKNPLFGSKCFGTFIGPVDIIDLLHDIEQKLI